MGEEGTELGHSWGQNQLLQTSREETWLTGFPANTTLFYPFFPIIVRQPVEVSRFSKFGKISNPDVRQPVNVSIVFNNFLTGPNIVRSPVRVSRFRVKSEKMLPLVRKLSVNL